MSSIASPGVRAVIAPVFGGRPPEALRVVTIVCYLDDSGSGLDRPIVTMAGYVARLEEWSAFESKGRAYLTGEGIGVLHAVDFHKGEREFKGWEGSKKGRFLSGLYDLFAPHALFGVSSSAVHAQHAVKKHVTGLSLNRSAMGFCFNWILNRLMRDTSIPQGEPITLLLKRGLTVMPVLRSHTVA